MDLVLPRGFYEDSTSELAILPVLLYVFFVSNTVKRLLASGCGVVVLTIHEKH